MNATIPLRPSSPRIILVDDTMTFRELLRVELIRRFTPTKLLDFSDGNEGLAACMADPPDLLIIDLYLRDQDGRDVISELRARNIQTRILVLTAYPEANLPAELVALGVAGFVDKNSPLEQIDRAVQRVLDGGMFFSAAVPPPVPSLSGEPTVPRTAPSTLSEREREVVRLVARGMPSKEIAGALGLSMRTVEKHRSRILSKLGLHDMPTLVRWCLRNGLG